MFEEMNAYVERRKQHRRLDNMITDITIIGGCFLLWGIFTAIPELSDLPSIVRFALVLQYWFATFVAYLRVGRAYGFANSERELSQRLAHEITNTNG